MKRTKSLCLTAALVLALPMAVHAKTAADCKRDYDSNVAATKNEGATRQAQIKSRADALQTRINANEAEIQRISNGQVSGVVVQLAARKARLQRENNELRAQRQQLAHEHAEAGRQMNQRLPQAQAAYNSCMEQVRAENERREHTKRAQ